MSTPLVSFVGVANSGKTTYLEKLIAEMKRRGYKIGVIKHDVHGFDIDIPGKDSWRHAQAGADVVCISSPVKTAVIRRVDREMTLPELARDIGEMDIIFTEGYKRQGLLKIEVFREAVSPAPVCPRDELLALVSDSAVYEGVPRFALDNVAAMADFLETDVIKQKWGGKL